MNLPGAEEIINEMIENAKTPLEEILERQVHITQKPEIKEYKRTDSIKLSNVLNINEPSEHISKSL